MSGMVKVRTDIFPAVVTVTRGGRSATVDRVRVIVTQDAITVFQDAASDPSGVRVIFYDLLEDLVSSNQALTSGGSTVEWTKQQGCGCGSRLRSFNPYESIVTMGSSADGPSDELTQGA